MEAAALSRADLPAGKRVPHYLLLDEFSQFMAQSEESLTRMLSETRKYNLFCVMAHQNWSQASERLKGALQNVGLEVILKTGRADAEYSARLLGAVNPLSIKHTVADEAAVERTHPTFFPLAEQWETYTQAIQQLRTGQAFLRLPDDTVRRVATPTLPAVTVPASQLAAVWQHYLATYFRPLPQSRLAGPQQHRHRRRAPLRPPSLSPVRRSQSSRSAGTTRTSPMVSPAQRGSHSPWSGSGQAVAAAAEQREEPFASRAQGSSPAPPI